VTPAFAEGCFVCFALQEIQIIEERQHVLRRFLYDEQRLQARQNDGTKLVRRQVRSNGKNIGQDVRKQVDVFHLIEISASVGSEEPVF
jgi:hypothetical protein